MNPVLVQSGEDPAMKLEALQNKMLVEVRKELQKLVRCVMAMKNDNVNKYGPCLLVFLRRRG